MAVKTFLRESPLAARIRANGRALLGVAGLVALAGILFLGGNWWSYHRHHATTDDAYVRADVTPISTRVEGTVARVLVADNAAVHKGDVLLELDPADLDLAVRSSQARLEQAMAQVYALHAAVAQARAELATVTAEAKRTQGDYERMARLAGQHVVSEQAIDHARSAASESDAKRLSVAKALDHALTSLGGDPNQPIEDNSLLREARAALEQAKLDRSHAIVTAPADGYVSQKSVESGQRVEKGQPVMALVELESPYVLANFKETDLTRVRIGQPAEIRVDLYPNTVYRGRVDSIDSGTGAAFSLLPPQNASGNWVKIVQRVPVKIVLDEPPPADRPLRVGLSADVSVDISDLSGPLLSRRGAARAVLRNAQASP